MNFSINIMDTGNKIFIVCENRSHKMFPFDDTLNALLPVVNKNSLTLLLESIRSFYDKDIYILAPESAEIAKIANKYKAMIILKNENYLHQIYELAKDSCAIALFKGETVLHQDDVKQIFHQLATMKAGILIKNNDKEIRSIDTIGVKADNTVHAIFAHPREHYVNAHICGAYVLDRKSIEHLQYCEPGFHNVNCGQMPDEKYYLEEAIQNAIEDCILFESIWCKQKHVLICYPWDIREANELLCEQLCSLKEDKIAKTAYVDDSCSRSGYIKVGKNSIVRNNVVFEGNCVIGNDVIIEIGAIIGANCYIGDGSVIRHHCKIDSYSVIGPNNKIGFNAEISGVTFNGVCAVHGCEVFGVIGKKVDIAAGVQMAILRFDDTQTVQKVASKKYSNSYTNNICIGNYCRTGVNNVFLPGVKIGSRSALGPCLMIDKDIPENSLVTVVQETVVKEWGSHRYGW